jgi:hypothetical protein
MRSRCMSLLPRTTLHSDSEQIYLTTHTNFRAEIGEKKVRKEWVHIASRDNVSLTFMWIFIEDYEIVQVRPYTLKISM